MLKTWLYGEPPGNPVRIDGFVVAVSEMLGRNRFLVLLDPSAPILTPLVLIEAMQTLAAI
jgi:hypothetical protein